MSADENVDYAKETDENFEMTARLVELCEQFSCMQHIHATNESNGRTYIYAYFIERR